MKVPECRYFCVEYMERRNGSGSEYAMGLKKCNTCERFLRVDGYFCPCCGRKLKTKSKFKEVVRI